MRCPVSVELSEALMAASLHTIYGQVAQCGARSSLDFDVWTFEKIKDGF